MKKLMILAIFLLVFSIIFSTASANTTPKECLYIGSVGLASQENPSVVDADKLIAVLTSPTQGYSCFKQILGIGDYDFFITITDTTGTKYSTISSTISGQEYNLTGLFGVFPGRTQEEHIYSVDAEFAESVSLSPTYIPPAGGMTGYFLWAPEEQRVLASPRAIEDLITHDIFNFQQLKTFKRVVVIDNGAAGYETALITLGVWY